MRLQAGPREDEAGNEREEDPTHQTRHPGRPIGTPKVNYRRATQAGVSQVLPPSAGGSIREVAQRPKFGRLGNAVARRSLKQQGEDGPRVPVEPSLARLLTAHPK